MSAMKFPFRPVTKPQIKKIHTLKSVLGLSDDNYEALLYCHGVESSKEFNRESAAKFIEDLLKLQNGEPVIGQAQTPTGILSYGNKVVYFNRVGKATDNQIDYMGALWFKVTETNNYEALIHFIKKVTGVLYIHVESLSVKEASNVIYVLEKWNKQKEIR